MIEPTLLRSVRSEIEEHLSFTKKETDIYKIFQSGDLANLDGLDDASLARLPSLLQLRDALYSSRFREYLSSVTGSGKLSGRKTDMAINVYTPGCHLLCHDDVIGTRRVSYILYLTDPDRPWQPEWGGALRLYPTTSEKDANGEQVKIPSPDFSKSIPPAFNQLSFFTVQPGESFHDVEEVYHPDNKGNSNNGDAGKAETQKRVRMAISGWFHIPQEGEDGYEAGLAESLAERSSLAQLQGRGDIYDQPQPMTVTHAVDSRKGGDDDDDDDSDFTESDLSFLVQYINASYLTPDVAEELSETFSSESSLSLDRVLCDKFAARVKAYIEEQETAAAAAAVSSAEIEKTTSWKVACPPHKHRFLFEQPLSAANGAVKGKSKLTPIQELLNDLLPSAAFRKWLSLITGAERITSSNLLARRFRRGQDYTLASTYEGDSAQLEMTLCLTPTPGWEKGDDDDEEEEEEEDEEENGDGDADAKVAEKNSDEPSVGGYEVYMAGDDDDDEADDDQDEPPRHKNAKSKADPAVYRSAEAGEDDGILFSTAAGWNRLSIVLRDRGTLRFVKFVSAAAKGDRWDVTGEFGVDFGDDDDDDDDQE